MTKPNEIPFKISVDSSSVWAQVHGDSTHITILENTLEARMDQDATHSPDGRAISRTKPWYRDNATELHILTGCIAELFGDQLPRAIPVGRLGGVSSSLLWLAGKGFRDYQLSAIEAAIGAPMGRSVIEVATGGGKTHIAWGIANAAAKSFGHRKWLYTVYGKDLLKQAESSFACMGDDHAVIRVISWGQLQLLQSARGGLRCTEWDGLIVDECHQVAAAQRAQAITQFKGLWRVGLSGTPQSRTDNKNWFVTGLLGPVVYRITVDQLTDDGYLAPGSVVLINTNFDGRSK